MLLDGSKAMLKFFKKVFGSSPAEDHANGNGYATPYATADEQSNPAAVAAAYGTPSPATASQWGQAGGVRVSLPSIIAVLPLELKTRIKQTMVAGMYVTLPMGHVLAQLAAGAIRMTFGELRAAAPNVFSPQADRDAVQITLPLHEILQQVPPEYLPRRQSQKQISVPEDVRGPFGNDGFGVTFADTKTITGTQIPSGQTPTAPTAPIQPVQPVQPIQPVQPMRPVAPTPPGPIAFRPPVPPTNLRPPVPPAAQNPPVPPANLKPPGPGIPTRGSFGTPQPQAPQAPQTPRHVQPSRPTPPASTPANAGAPNPAAPRPAIPLRGTFSSTPTPPPPTATPPAFPPVRPAFPTARGAGATDSPPPVPRMPASSNGNGHAQPTPVPQPATSGSDICIDVPLAAVTESWPEVLRGEIHQLNLSGAHVALPMRVVDPALRQGRVAFTWKVLRSWIRPAILPTVSAHDDIALELPLHVIAPLFIAKQKQTSFYRKDKVAVDENIPNLFFGFPQPDSEESAVEEPVAEQPSADASPDIGAVFQKSPATPVSPPSPGSKTSFQRAKSPAPPQPETTETSAIFSPAPKLKPAGVPDTNYYVWGDSADTPRVDETEFKRKSTGGTEFMARYATPNEVVSRAAALDGVAGALVALPDGLMVASKLSADLNGDTLAAFLPHIFGKVSQCTKELRMGELNNLHFTVGNVPWKIFRVNAIFFAVFGRAGQPLPTVQLAALAAELDRKK